MDLVEIDYHDYLAEQAINIDDSFTHWFTYEWENYMLSHYKVLFEKDKTLYINDIQFRVGDDLICLSEGVYEKEPHTSISPNFGGRIATLSMLATIFIRDGKLKGKMKIYNASKPPINTNYELFLKNAEMKMIVGIKICGDGWNYDNCKYQFVKSDLSFTYLENSKEISVFDRETDSNKRELLEQYMLEYITEELGPALEDYQVCKLCEKASVSSFLGNDYSAKNMLSIHNKKMRQAFRYLTRKIISIANSKLLKRSPELELSELFGLTGRIYEGSNAKFYSGYIDNFDSLDISPDDHPIIFNKGDLLIVYAPVEFEGLKLSITDDIDAEPEEQTYETSGSYITMSLKRLSDNEAKISLVDFKVLNIKPLYATPINIPMDHSIAFAIEQHVKPFLEEAMTEKELQELAIKPDVEIEYDSADDLMAEDSENDG